MASPAQHTEESTQEHHGDAPGTGRVPFFASVAAVLCLTGLGLTLVLGGAVFPEVIPGLPDAGEAVRWGMPIAKVAMDAAAVLVVGLLMVAVLLVPSHKGRLYDQSVTYLHGATWAALVWAVATVFTLYFETSEFLAAPFGQVSIDEVTAYAGSVAGGIALMLILLITTGIALFGRTVTTATGGLWLLIAALAATTPTALTGHAASAGAHELAVTGLALHVVTITMWVGGLIAVTYHLMRTDAREPVTAVNRFSRMALWLYIGVAVSGAASALARLETLGDLFLTEYGLIIVVKIMLFAVLGLFGYLHREFALKQVASAPEGSLGDALRQTLSKWAAAAKVLARAVFVGSAAEPHRVQPAAPKPTLRRVLFLRIAGVEAAIMAAVIGISVGLGRTSPPPPLEDDVDPAAVILGFPVPPAMSAETLLTLWRPDLFFIMVVVIAGSLYLGGVYRLVRRGDTWNAARTVSFLLGLLTIVAVQLSGFATYAMVLFSSHMIQHMVISMLTPILLVLGAPITLALRALRPARVRGDRGPREWLNLFLNSRFGKGMTHPAVAAPLFVFSPYVLYFTPLFPALMNDHLGHMFMSVHFLLTGFLFYWIIIGLDPAPRKIPYLLRILLLLMVMGLHAFFGIAIMMQSAPMAMDFYNQFEVPWSNEAEDQYAGGGVAWALGEIPTLVVTVALLYQWSRDDERQERRRARQAQRGGSDDADMDAYNAYLAELDRRSRGGGTSGTATATVQETEESGHQEADERAHDPESQADEQPGGQDRK